MTHNDNRVLFVVCNQDDDTLEVGLAVLPRDERDHLNFFYRCLDCKTIDIITRKIGNRYYDFVIDDEGKLNQKPATAVMIHDNQVYDFLAGSFLVTTHDDDGNTLPLSSDDLKYIREHLETSIFHGFECLVLHY